MSPTPYPMMTLKEHRDRQIAAAARKDKRSEKRLAGPLYRGQNRPKSCDSGLSRRKAASSARKRLVAQLDVLFSLYVRRRDAKGVRRGLCPFHADRQVRGTQCFHFIGRTKYATRWLAINAVTSCGGCNLRFEHDSLFVNYVLGWYREIYGAAQWDALLLASNRRDPMTTFELEEIRNGLKAKLESACNQKPPKPPLGTVWTAIRKAGNSRLRSCE